MQNKVQPKRTCRQVHTSLVQHELLATKKYFEFVKTHEPSNMLSGAMRESVCVYGNFYETAPGRIDDMSVFTASKLAFKGVVPCRVTSLYPTKEVEYRGTMDDLTTMGAPGKDFNGTDNLEKFGDLVEAVYIGEPVSWPGLKSAATLLRTLPRESYRNNSGKTLDDLCEELEEMARLLENAEKSEEISEGKFADKLVEASMLMGGYRQVVMVNCDEK